ncbi:TlyA family rRNA (cytidine-2'-O)-methyltransferase [Candidatus Saccharibacteria bacterium]|nr:TlyA family rRNA (cytidine-2'-O)-methyltransferase [Candidatus Saccharibacteria bacterium]
MSEKSNKYVSRAGDKLADANLAFKVDFRGKTVLDIGSSTGGFTDYALQQGASKVIAVEIGTNQLHPKLRADKRVELYEKTDIFDFWPQTPIDIVVIDTSFISLRKVLGYLQQKLINSSNVVILAMLKPQFEANSTEVVNGVVKNSTIRRRIIKDFEQWVKPRFKICSKKDNAISGMHGNIERFYMLRPINDNR